MAVANCPECQAIQRELQEWVEISKSGAPRPGASIHEMIAWFEQRNLDEDYVSRVRPALASVRRRLVDHYSATGHRVLTPLPPGSLTHPN